jgi:hypothetical protein
MGKKFDPSKLEDRRQFGGSLTIYCVVDAYDPTTTNAAFLTRNEAEAYKAGREDSLLVINEMKVLL